MAHVYVYKAQPIAEDGYVQSKTIHVEETMPAARDSDEYHGQMAADARKVEEALYHSLPRGTYDRLLGLMLQRMANTFVVAYGAMERNER